MSGSKKTCQIVTGLLAEVRMGGGLRSVADVNEMIELLVRAVAPLPLHAMYSIAADWREVQVMAPETAERATYMLAHFNPRVRRSAILTLTENPTTNLQVVRLVREAQNPSRRHFTDPAAMHRWLSEVLTPEESARLSVFLALP